MKKSSKLTVGVFFGGKSTEHEVSVITGLQVLHNIDKQKYNVIPVYVSKEGHFFSGDNLFSAETFKNLNEIPLYSKELKLNKLGAPIFKIASKGSLKAASSATLR